MFKLLRSSLYLLVVTLIICCILYPAVLWAIGRVAFPNKADGSLVYDKANNQIGSRLIAQPFTADEYFQPRPSATSPTDYNAAASGGSNYSANNYLLRDRVARKLGLIVKYAAARKGEPVAPDIEAWFQKDQFGGSKGIVAQWANLHSRIAQDWIKADPMYGAAAGWIDDVAKGKEDNKNAGKRNSGVAVWQDAVAKWKEKNKDAGEPKPEDIFFEIYSKIEPGTFPVVVENKVGGETKKQIKPVKEGADIQSYFFDMWLQDNPEVELEPVPADMVMTSGSGLDPDITLQSALYQLDRVAGAWAKKTKEDKASIRKEIEDLLRQNASAPFAGLFGDDLVNVLEVNMKLRDLYGSQVVAPAN